jgi:hypothetical protein
MPIHINYIVNVGNIDYISMKLRSFCRKWRSTKNHIILKSEQGLGFPELVELAETKLHGGSRGYSMESRINSLNLKQNGFKDATLLGASGTSLWRWGKRLLPLRSTGNKAARAIDDENQFHLILYGLLFPTSTLDEKRRFIFESARTSPPILFTRGEISAAETRLRITRKRSSTDAYQAELPHNVFRRSHFWNSPPPLGVVGIPFDTLSDTDEAKFCILSCNRKYGKAFRCCRVRDMGNYGYSDKYTLIATFGADESKHIDFDKEIGTTNERFHAHVESLLQNIPANVHKTFMWDNLSAHKFPATVNMVMTAGHRVLPRPAYSGKDGPCEYIFCQIETRLKQCLHAVHTELDLQQAVARVIGEVTGIANTFRHCGYE